MNFGLVFVVCFDVRLCLVSTVPKCDFMTSGENGLNFIIFSKELSQSLELN